MTWKGKWPGTWAVNCQVCGFRFPSNKIKKRWDGILCCEQDWEPRHPQTMIKVRGETAIPTFVNKDGENNVFVCNIASSSGYVGLGRVGCAKVGNNQFTYAFLLDWLRGGIPGFGGTCDVVTSSGYVGLATIGCAQTGNNTYTYDYLTLYFS